MNDKLTTIYVQQEQHPGGWTDHAATDDREMALSRYKAFAGTRERPTRLIERTERVLATDAPTTRGRSRGK